MTEYKRNGETSSHEEAIPQSYSFGGKDTYFAAETQEKNPLSDIMAIVNNPDVIKPDKNEVGMLRIRSVNSWLREAKERPDPKQLWRSFWYEGEVCVLFSDTNKGKSVLGFQIGVEVAKSQKVIYFDFELSDKQLQLRYQDEERNLFIFPENLLRAELNAELLNEEDFEEAIMNDIEEATLRNECKVIIVDNISFLANETEKANSAGNLMKSLIRLKRKWDLSILVVAHTPKRSASSPITQNDLAGSKRLINFTDSAFAVGESAKDDRLRYIKQIKVRNGGFEFGGDNVLLCEIVKEDGWLHFREIGISTEKEHLKETGDKDVLQLEEDIKDLKEQGLSVRDIANKLMLSKSKVGRILKEYNG